MMAKIWCCRAITPGTNTTGSRDKLEPVSRFVAKNSRREKTSAAAAAALLVFVLGACRWPGSHAPSDLKLVAALPIEAAAGFQPSGLTLEDGHVLTVSDHDDAVIHELALGPVVARARSYASFLVPSEVAGGAASSSSSPRLDLEGIARVAPGKFWLLSEGRCRVLEVTSVDGTAASGQARWLTDSLESVGLAAGLFQTAGAGLEGLAPLPNGGVLLAGEREPRGLIELVPGFALGSARAWRMPTSQHAIPTARAADFADLTLVDGDVFALVRNAHLVVRLERTTTGWREGPAWSYAAVENDPRFRYADRKFGLAEGLAVSARELFIVLDNNEQPRASDPRDRRPLLLRFERPSDLGAGN
jgi:hypothetical protein